MLTVSKSDGLHDFLFQFYFAPLAVLPTIPCPLLVFWRYSIWELVVGMRLAWLFGSFYFHDTVQTYLTDLVCDSLIHYLSDLSIQNLQETVNPKPKCWGAKILREYSPPTMCHMSCVTCHLSLVMCQVSGVTCQVSCFFLLLLLAKWWS